MALHPGSSQNESTTGSSNPRITEANPALGQRLTSPKSRLAQDPVPADVAYQLIHDERTKMDSVSACRSTREAWAAVSTKAERAGNVASHDVPNRGKPHELNCTDSQAACR